MQVTCKSAPFYVSTLSGEKTFSQIIDKDPFDKCHTVTDLHFKLKIYEHATMLLCQQLENLSTLLGE